MFPLPRAVETQSLAAHGASLGQGEGQTITPVLINTSLQRGELAGFETSSRGQALG